MKPPQLSKNQFAVGTAKYLTGHVLKKDSSFFLEGDDVTQLYEVFYSYEEAQRFVIENVSQSSEIECWIIDSEGKCLFTYDQKGERKLAK